MNTPVSANTAAAAAADLALARGFAERLGRLARMRGASSQAVRWLERAAYAVSRATAEGHVCVALRLKNFEQTGLPRERDDDRMSVREVRENLLATGLVCDGSGPDAALAPLVLDADDRLYLARYFAYERQLARALVLRVPSISGQSIGGQNIKQPNIARRGDANPDANPTILARQLATWFGAAQTDQIDWQRVAAALALSGRLTVISGGPGTGKTSTVVAILASLLAQSAAQDQALPRIALAAPTGKAAQRMQEALLERADALPAAQAAALPRQAYTLHRLLGVGPDGRFRHHRDAPLPYDVVVVDEASMIDVALAARLIDAVPADCRLILLGDKDQLAAVEAGAVFAELSGHPQLSTPMIARLAPALGLSDEQFDTLLPPSRRRDEVKAAKGGGGAVLADCVVWLERNYRFGLSSPIGRLSLAIRDGMAGDALAVLAAHPERAALHEDGDARLSDAALARLAQGYASYARALGIWLEQGLEQEQGQGRADDSAHAWLAADPTPLFDAFNFYRVLCATRGGARGVLALNRRLAAQIRRAAQRPGLMADPAAGSIANDANAFSNNDLEWYAGRPVMVTRNDYAMGLFNGDIGIALPTARGMRVVFRQAAGGYRWVSPATLPQHETAFALTVHKSQGSEFAEAALVLPAAAGRVLSRELVYTAVTRARERVVLYAARAVLAQAIAARTERDSGLAARLAEALEAMRARV